MNITKDELLNALDYAKKHSKIKKGDNVPSIGPSDLQRAFKWNYAKAASVIQLLRKADPLLEGPRPWLLTAHLG
jgi:hypothetical protein